MDRKSIIIVVICFAMLMLWPRLVEHLYPSPPPSTNVVSSAGSSLLGTNAPAASQPAPPALEGSNAPAAFVVNSTLAEQELVVTNDNARYVFTSRGGGLKKIELNHYPESVQARKGTDTNQLASLNTPSAPPVLAVLGEGAENLQGDGNFLLAPTPNGVRAEKVLSNGLVIVKDFQIGTNYLLSASVWITNRSKQPVALPAQQWVVGTATPMNAQDNVTRMRTLGIWSYDGAKVAPLDSSYFATNTTMFFGMFNRTPHPEYRAVNSNLVWVSAQNRFFALATMPRTAASGLEVHPVDLPPPNQEEIDANPQTVTLAPRGLEASLEYPAQTLAPGQAVERSFDLFAGPKEYHTLADVANRFNNNIDYVMGFNGFWGWFARQLLTIMELFHRVLGLQYGWAIVATTVLLKLLFWPLTQYSTKSMKKMQALQPQMKAMQEKYKDDPAKMTQKQMEFWKKHKVSPLSGCLPMMLQIPFLGGFYRMLQSAIELRGAHFLWITDLSKPDTLFLLPGFDFPVNPLPLLMGATMLWQSHMTPPSPGMDPAQQKMMRYMPLMFLFVMYRYPSGLALYWTVQNLLGILQTKMIQTTSVTTPAPPSAPTPAAPQKKKR
jgi:YidC/Oxa1 family membrane protein insertase